MHQLHDILSLLSYTIWQACANMLCNKCMVHKSCALTRLALSLKRIFRTIIQLRRCVPKPRNKCLRALDALYAITARILYFMYAALFATSYSLRKRPLCRVQTRLFDSVCVNWCRTLLGRSGALYAPTAGCCANKRRSRKEMA